MYGKIEPKTKSDRNTDFNNQFPVQPGEGPSLNEATPQDWDQASALARQVGGKHYKQFAIQPIEFVMANKLDYCEANIVKYACRHHEKGGIQDVDKIIHYAELLKELVYGKQ